ncbi:hypothetical protein LTR12_008747 [Friedmanniomyces endolithicus]|nr:hypothetical protein LTR74_004494 [Friedmanniomyces endolithicus]KAK1816805.1 hypothetical protein LTR12_008747 [Friedmanniomyces endolithicus]
MYQHAISSKPPRLSDRHRNLPLPFRNYDIPLRSSSSRHRSLAQDLLVLQPVAELQPGDVGGAFFEGGGEDRAAGAEVLEFVPFGGMGGAGSASGAVRSVVGGDWLMDL